MNETVTISLYKFERLISKSQKYDMLLKKLIESSALSWSNEWLTFDSGVELSDLIRMLEPVIYEERLEDLKEREDNGDK